MWKKAFPSLEIWREMWDEILALILLYKLGIFSDLGLHQVLRNRVILPHWAWRLVQRLWCQPIISAPISVYVLKFVDFASILLTILCGVIATIWHRIGHAHHALLACCGHISVLHLLDKVGICLEVESLLSVVLDGCESTLTNTFSPLILRPPDLLLDAVRVIVINLLESMHKEN